MTRFFCEYAWLGGEECAAGVSIEVDNGVISSVRRGEPGSGGENLSGLTLPGFANAHSHAFQRALRGRTHGGAGSFWTWRDQMYALAAKLEPDSYHALARAVFAEMLQAGITCVGEFHYLHHGRHGVAYDNANEMGLAILNAASEAGIRITLLDTCYLYSAPEKPATEIQMRFSDGTAGDWADRVADLVRHESPSVKIAAAIHSVRAVDPDSMHDIAEWARRKNMVLHAHVSEQPAENEQCIRAYAITPTQLLSKCGVLSPRFTAVHATHLTAHDMALLGRSRSSVCFCPTTERDLADGIGPSTALRTAGATLTVGSDSHAVIDMLEEGRTLELNERLATQSRGNHPVVELLAAFTERGHHALGWMDAGRLEPGKLADFASVRLDSVRTVGGAMSDVLQRVLFTASSADVHTVVVGGKVVVSDGRHRTIDATGELSSSIAALT